MEETVSGAPHRPLRIHQRIGADRVSQGPEPTPGSDLRAGKRNPGFGPDVNTLRLSRDHDDPSPATSVCPSQQRRLWTRQMLQVAPVVPPEL
jgi:hypothetical protein